ncbi:MAG: DNA polymerase [Bacteriovoracia bacterium]
MIERGYRPALAPLKYPKHAEPFAVLDIEGRDWIHHVLTGTYDGKEYRHFKRHGDFLRYAFNQPTNQYFAHFGGIYDFLFTLDCALSSLGNYRLIELIPRGSGILSFTLESGGRRITFRDSSALFPFGLKKLAASFGVVTQKGELDFSKIRGITQKLIDYNAADCKALWESLDAFYSTELIRRCGPKTTLASQAMQFLRTTLKEKISGLSDGHDYYVRKAYAGGRVEIFRPLFLGPFELHCYDFNSLYPAVMQSAIPPTEVVDVQDAWNEEDLGFVDCDVEVPDQYMPPLWVREWQDAAGKPQTKMIFPTGKLRGRWPSVELKHAIACGARIVKVRSFLKMRAQGEIFRDFVTELYALRKSSTDPVQNVTAKLLMNSCYGRMGMRKDQEKLELDMGQAGTPLPFIQLRSGEIRLIRVPTTSKGFSNVAIAAWITALARIRLHGILRSNSDSAYYCDTDSIFTTQGLSAGDDLGSLKLEYSVKSACFILPKTYIAGSIVKAKGIPKEKITALALDDFTKALEGDRSALKFDLDQKMLRMRSAIQKGKLLTLSKSGAIKRIVSSYDKRTLYKDESGVWNSRPIHFNNWNSVQ